MVQLVIKKEISDSTHKIIYVPQTSLNRLSDNSEAVTEIDQIIKNIVLTNKKC